MLFFSLTYALPGCSTKHPDTDATTRLEALFARAGLHHDDSVRYVVWNTMSCAGCRSFTVKLLQKGGNSVRFIVPPYFVNDIGSINPQAVFVDSLGIFGKQYFGVDNIGIITLYRNKVLSIKNYQANEMERLRQDLGG